jgi:hypothetical protein
MSDFKLFPYQQAVLDALKVLGDFTVYFPDMPQDFRPGLGMQQAFQALNRLDRERRKPALYEVDFADLELRLTGRCFREVPSSEVTLGPPINHKERKRLEAEQRRQRLNGPKRGRW